MVGNYHDYYTDTNTKSYDWNQKAFTVMNGRMVTFYPTRMIIGKEYTIDLVGQEWAIKKQNDDTFWFYAVGGK